jgi:hypothetical protein
MVFAAKPQPIPRDIVAYCKTLSYGDCQAFIERLGKMRRFADLEKIFNSDVDCESYAATVYASELSSTEVVAFCKKFPVGSANWESAFDVLGTHPRKHVIAYVKEIAHSRSPRIRALCYLVCTNTQWEDLIPIAQQDLSNIIVLYFDNLFPETLGRIAARYLQTCKRKPRAEL